MPVRDNNGYVRGGSKNRRAKKRDAEPVYWDSRSTPVIFRLVESAQRAGGAIRFGGNRNNTMLALGVYGDGEPYTEYFRDTGEFEDFAEDLILVFNGMAEAKE